MSFTYTEDLTDDRDFVRFHTGDVREGEALLSDQLIASLLTVSASKEAAVVSALEHMIAAVNVPTFKADWLQVDVGAYVQALERRLERKKSELGVAFAVRVGVDALNVYRPDSQQVSAEVFDADAY